MYEWNLDIDTVGFKYRMNDLAAAVGLGNLEDFALNLARRREIGARYRAELVDVPGLELLRFDEDRTHAYWLFPVLVERREDFIRKLKDHGIPTSVVHLSIDRYDIFGGLRDDLPGQAEFNERQIHLPLHSGLSDPDTCKVISAVRGGW